MGAFNPGALSYYPNLIRVVDHVLSDLSRPVSLEEAAKVACLSPTYFAARFKDKAGASFHEWLGEQRLTHAQAMLRNSDVALVEVAGAVGVSQRTLQRLFRRHTGRTPREYRDFSRTQEDLSRIR